MIMLTETPNSPSLSRQYDSMFFFLEEMFSRLFQRHRHSRSYPLRCAALP